MVSIIAAIGKNRALGKNNSLLWKLPDDMKRFKKLTTGHPVIMGSRTFESIGRPLPGRTNIVVSAEKKDFEGCLAASSPEEAVKLAETNGGDPFVIGGGQIYKSMLPLADKLYLTFVDDSPEADVFFPEFDENEWILQEKENHPADEKHAVPFSFATFARKKNLVDPRYAKTGKYSEDLKEAQKENACPLCTLKWHTNPILKRESGWFITETTQPYKNSKIHLLVIPDNHKDDIKSISENDWAAILKLFSWAVSEFKIPGGGIALRFGDSLYTGASIKHLHFHLIVPAVEGDKATPVWFPFG